MAGSSGQDGQAETRVSRPFWPFHILYYILWPVGFLFRRLGLVFQAAENALIRPSTEQRPKEDAGVHVQAQCTSLRPVPKIAISPINDKEEIMRLKRELARQAEMLARAHCRLETLQAAPSPLCSPPHTPPMSPGRDKPIKLFVDGVFDLMHFGHMNAFRQARALGTYLVVGVNSDESVLRCKGNTPILNDVERQQAVAACRFVDEIVPASPYVMTREYIQEMIDTYDIDYFVHGDDPCIVDGEDVYGHVKQEGMFKSIPRTDGISTTDIAGRTLLLTKDHHKELTRPTRSQSEGASVEKEVSYSFVSQHSKFLVTSKLVQLFSASLPKHEHLGKVVYVDGAWDMFHCGHIALLKKAKQLGDHLVVGVHSDAVVNKQRGYNYPIMAMNERVLSVLGCRYTDDVLLDAPWHITEEMVATLNISVVVRGTVHDCGDCKPMDPRDPHDVPIKMGIHKELKSDSGMTIGDIVSRLQLTREKAEKRLAEKQRKEDAWYREKHGLAK